MSFWKRLFSADYRAGRGAEAVGDWLEAARRFGSCGADADLLRVTRHRIDGELDLRARVSLHRQACRLVRELGESPAPDHRDLAEALLRLARVVEPPEARELHREAADSYLVAGAPAEAGRVLEEAGLWEQATAAYIEAGDLDAVERTAARSQLPGAQSDEAVDLPGWIATLLAMGDVERALDAVAEAERTGAPDATAARQHLEKRLPAPFRLVLAGPDGCVRLCAEPTAEVGREPGLALPLGAASLSRRHLVLKRAGASLVVACASTGASISVGGAPLLAPTAFDEAAELVLGEQCALSVRPEADAWHIRARVAGVEGDLLVLGDAFAVGDLRLAAQGRWWRAPDRVLLLGDEVPGFTVVG